CLRGARSWPPAQGDKPIGLRPALGLIPELTLAIGIGTFGDRCQWAAFSSSTQREVLRAETMNCTCRFALGATAFQIVEARIGSRIDCLNGGRQSLEHAFQMPGHLRTCGAIAVSQFAADVLPASPPETSRSAVALLILGVVALASAHLVAEQGVHRGVGIQGDRCSSTRAAAQTRCRIRRCTSDRCRLNPRRKDAKNASRYMQRQNATPSGCRSASVPVPEIADDAAGKSRRKSPRRKPTRTGICA